MVKISGEQLNFKIKKNVKDKTSTNKNVQNWIIEEVMKII